jgi:hypothetical protein
MDALVDTLTGVAGLGLLFALTAWLPLKTGEGGCGGCSGECATCPEAEGRGPSRNCGPAECTTTYDLGGTASCTPSPGARPREAKDRA